MAEVLAWDKEQKKEISENVMAQCRLYMGSILGLRAWGGCLSPQLTTQTDGWAERQNWVNASSGGYQHASETKKQRRGSCSQWAVGAGKKGWSLTQVEWRVQNASGCHPAHDCAEQTSRASSSQVTTGMASCLYAWRIVVPHERPRLLFNSSNSSETL